ncbi:MULTISPECIES: diguanylate cyclase domain-containing protein [unclassified Arthrobacter]|uniref:diguanylate cyclase domain-containing protein n=1 Tax=unclassified Arthrobacter TaxID=235627 RepID=UPI002E1276A2|nr:MULTISPECIES: diguanylate cyclase [unclassified Arthrobacter]
MNDTYGHAADDASMVEIARRLTTCIRNGDTVARTGGDEFAPVFPGSSVEQGTAVARRVRIGLDPECRRRDARARAAYTRDLCRQIKRCVGYQLRR